MAKKKRKRTNYIRGRETEYRCKAALIKEGYRIMRASSSKGDFDIIAYNHERTRYVQLKREMKRQGSYPSEREKIRKIDIPLFLTGIFNGVEVTIPLPNTKELWIWTDKLGWSQWTIKQDGTDEHTDSRRGKRKTNKS